MKLRGIVLLTVLGACQGQIQDLSSMEPLDIPSDPADPDAPRVLAPRPECDGVCVGANHLARLTREQYRAGVEEAFGEVRRWPELPEDGTAGAFASNDASGGSAGVGRYQAAALSLAAELAAGVELRCDPDADAESCGLDLHARYAPALFRRFVGAEEAQPYGELFAWSYSEDGALGATELVLSALLQSPHFLYRPERVDSERPELLDGNAVANRLAAFLWSGAPDEELLHAAEDGELESASGVLAAAERMLEDPRADASMARFVREWLQLGSLDAGLEASMRAESEGFVEALMRSEEPTLRTLLTSTYAPVDERLAEFYGVEAGSWVERSDRPGILTHASVMKSHSSPNFTQPIFRGVLVRTEVLCHPVYLPDDEEILEEVDAAAEEQLDPDRSTREQVAEATSGDDCAGCHALINDLGFAFEAFAEDGSFREVDHRGESIETQGELLGAGPASPFEGPHDLLSHLADNEDVEECIVEQWFRHALGRTLSEADHTSLYDVAVVLNESEGNLREMILAIVQTDSFRYRRLPR